jgi:uncharacterized protein (DUF302 family)
MTKITQTTIDHIEVSCNRSYDQVTTSLQERLGSFADPSKLRSQVSAGASWSHIERAIEGMLGSSDLCIFHKVEHGDLLSLQEGKPRRVSQYAIGNPLLAIRMIQHEPRVALYAPLRLAVYEDGEGQCVVACDRFTSLLARYQHPEIVSTAKRVEQKVDALIAEITGEERRTQEPDSPSTAATGVATGLVAKETQRPPELKPLDVLIGRWLTEGETVAAPGAAPVPIVASDVYQWAPGGHFVMHPAYGRIGDVGVGGLEIIGYDPATGQYRTHFFDSQGNILTETLSCQDGAWTWQGANARCTGIFSDNGRLLTARHERSDDGIHWEPSMTVKLRKID